VTDLGEFKIRDIPFGEDFPPYGHRDMNADDWRDIYYDPLNSGAGADQAAGCAYYAIDIPGQNNLDKLAKDLRVKFRIIIDLQFTGRIIDICNQDKIVAEKSWKVHCERDFGPSDFPSE
jgi:hypothetical protein